MIAACVLAALAIVDCTLAGFRAAAGRNGALDKRAYYQRAMLGGAFAGSVLVALHVIATYGLVTFAPAPAAVWTAATDAATTLVWIYGTYATLVFAAFGFYFAPIGEYRVLTSVIVFGPLTLLRRAVVVAGLAWVCAQATEPRIIALACLAGVTMLGVEPWLGRRYAGHWRALLEPEKHEGPGGNPDLRSSNY